MYLFDDNHKQMSNILPLQHLKDFQLRVTFSWFKSASFFIKTALKWIMHFYMNTKGIILSEHGEREAGNK